MKNFIKSAVWATVFVVALFSVYPGVQAQTTTLVNCPAGFTCIPVNCPAGMTCTPNTPQPANCPAGFLCVLTNNNGSSGGGGGIGSPMPVGNCYVFSNNLTLGSTGTDVVALQTTLLTLGYNIPDIASGATAKGYFGATTAAAVRSYQAANGIPATGFVGPLTRAKLNSSCTTTSTTGIVASLDPSSPQASTVQISTGAMTPNVPLAVFDLRSQNSPSTLQGLSLGVIVNSGNVNISNFFTIIQIKAGSQMYSETSIGSDNKTVLFSNLNIPLPANVSVPIIVYGSVAQDTNNALDGSSAVVELPLSGISAIDANYNNVLVNQGSIVGLLSGSTITFTSTGVQVSNTSATVGTETCNSVSNPTECDYPVSFNFSLTAGNNPIYIAKTGSCSAGYSCVANPLQFSGDTTQIIIQNASVISSAGDGSNYYYIAPGQTRQFTYSGVITNSNNYQNAGTYSVKVSGISYGTSSGNPSSNSITSGLQNLQVTVSFNGGGTTNQTKRQLVQTLYETIDCREPDAAGWDYWTKYPSSDVNTLTQAMEAGSIEYPTKQQIIQIYQQILGRAPSCAITNGTSELQNAYQLAYNSSTGQVNLDAVRQSLGGGTTQQPTIVRISAPASEDSQVYAGVKFTIEGTNFSAPDSVYVANEPATVIQDGSVEQNGTDLIWAVAPNDLKSGSSYVYVKNVNGISNQYNVTTFGSTQTSLPPVISGGTFPTSLMVGQQGIWTVNASDPQNGSLSYSVNWGDAGYSVASLQTNYVQTSTFSHSYQNSGTYTVTFMVKNSAGLTNQTSATVQVTGNTTPVCPVGYVCVPPTTIVQPTLTINTSDAVALGGTLNVSWTSTNTNSCSLADSVKGSDLFGGYVGSIQTTGKIAITNVSQDGLSSLPDTITITCTGSNGSVSKSATINPYGTTAASAVPAITNFTLTPSPVVRGQSATLSWTTSGGIQSCTIDSVSISGMFNSHLGTVYGPTGSVTDTVPLVIGKNLPGYSIPTSVELGCYTGPNLTGTYIPKMLNFTISPPDAVTSLAPTVDGTAAVLDAVKAYWASVGR